LPKPRNSGKNAHLFMAHLKHNIPTLISSDQNSHRPTPATQCPERHRKYDQAKCRRDVKPDFHLPRYQEPAHIGP
jgi:hypothetical protein